MVNFKKVTTNPFKTVADYTSMVKELKRVEKIVTDFEKGLIKQVGLDGGNVKFPDGTLAVNPFGKEEGRLNCKYKEMWLDLTTLVETAVIWNTSKKDILKVIDDIAIEHTNNTDVKQKVSVKKEVKTVKAKVTKTV